MSLRWDRRLDHGHHQLRGVTGDKDHYDSYKEQGQGPGSSPEGQQIPLPDGVGDPKDVDKGRRRQDHHDDHSAPKAEGFRSEIRGAIGLGRYHDGTPRDGQNVPQGQQTRAEVHPKRLNQNFPRSWWLRPLTVVGIDHEGTDLFRDDGVHV